MIAILLALAGASADSTAVPTDTALPAAPAVATAPATAGDSAIATPPSDSARELPAATTAAPPPAPPAAPVPAAGPVGPVGPIGPIGAGPVVSGPRPLVFGPQGAEVSVDTVSGPGGPSSWSMVGATLLLPGSVHGRFGRDRSAVFYHAVDLLGWTTLLVSWQSGRAALSSAAEIANRYAGASLGSSPDENLLSAMRNFRSRRPVAGRHDSYDEAQILSGRSTTREFADDDAHDWDWGATDNPDNNAHLRAFENQYRRWRTAQVAMYSATGTLVVLRLAAAMDILRLQRASAVRAGLSLETSPSPEGVAARLSWNF